MVKIRARTRSTITAVVKADGYGHGAVTVAKAAVAAGAGWLGTTSVAEASALRAARLAVPILTWLHPSGIDAEAVAATRVDVAVGSMDELGALLAHAAPTVRVHLHVDTGMSRGGCPRGQWDELIGLAQRGQQARRVRVVGVMGHLPLAVPADIDSADRAALTGAALRMFDALGCAGVARVDFFLTDDGPVLNEVNTMPGMTAESQVPRMFAAAGLSYEQLVARLVERATGPDPRARHLSV